MTVRLYSLSGVRLANGAEAPLGVDLDRPDRLPRLSLVKPARIGREHDRVCESWQWEPEDRVGTCDCGLDG